MAGTVDDDRGLLVLQVRRRDRFHRDRRRRRGVDQGRNPADVDGVAHLEQIQRMNPAGEHGSMIRAHLTIRAGPVRRKPHRLPAISARRRAIRRNAARDRWHVICFVPG
jgi:hypothetical protein